MIQLKPKGITAHVTIMVAVGLLLCTTAKASAVPDWEFNITIPPYFTNYGLLTLRPNSSAPWGSVCSEGFTDESALAACRSVGFDKIDTASLGLMNEKDTRYNNTGPIYITNVKCIPSADKLTPQNCNYSTITNKCRHSQDVWVQCGKNPETHILDYKLVEDLSIGIAGDPRVGRMTVQTLVHWSHGDICSKGLSDVECTAACRTLGFNVTHAGRVAKYKFSTRYDMTDLKCPAENNGLKDCTYKLDPAHRFNMFNFLCGPLFLDCHERHPDKWKFRIEESGTPGKGRLEMRPDEDKSWGSVCSNMFNDNSAMIMCKAAGYTDVTSARAILNYSSVSKPTTETERPIYLTDVLCEENATSLSSCTMAFNATGFPSSSVCTNMTDVGIECSGTSPTIPKNTGGNGKPPAPKVPAIPKTPAAKPSSVPTSLPTEPTTTTPLRPPSGIFTAIVTGSPATFAAKLAQYMNISAASVELLSPVPTPTKSDSASSTITNLLCSVR
eukprot:Tbor_TRINITY_DN6170_c0_g1::TRINITY_DN6170_c0_g1_i4::g.22300::m.22300